MTEQKEQQELIWSYLNDVTDKLNVLEKETEALKTVVIKMKPREYIEFLQTRTYLSSQELEFLKKKHGVV